MALALLLIALLQSPPAAPDALWVGKKIFPVRKFDEIKFADVVNRKDIVYEFHCRDGMAVEKEKLGYLFVFDGSNYGWVKKTDFAILEDAVAYWSRKIQDNKNDDTHYCMRGMAYMMLKQYDKAILDYNECLRIYPVEIAAIVNRGYSKNQMGKYDEAILDFDEALKLRPTESLAKTHRATAQYMLKKYDLAFKDYSSLNFAGMSATAHNDFAWLLATMPHEKLRNAAKSVEHAEKAIEMSRLNTPWTYYDTLAAAYAEKKDFDRAISTQKKAIELITSLKQDTAKMVGEAEARLKLYQEQKPYRLK